MFTPSRDQARQFFIDTWAKRASGQPLTQMETLAINLIARHPEYHALLEQGERALTREFPPELGETNPFLHLSLHLAIEEQLAIDQPPGIRAAFEAQRTRLGDEHAALHRVLDCLGETIWRAQRERQPPDGAAYVACIRKDLDA
ncbi:DUF1841 family protein [Methyloversatilis thermotolerans]|uniref:DUF1841 family protein n=1 Tax=Methyloversatilis thermotolerans TaxID=1346290 RepID=UPI0003789779|nr:DUF1841 family protein [Methyloversatilis thermotolerans]